MIYSSVVDRMTWTVWGQNDRVCIRCSTNFQLNDSVNRLYWGLFKLFEMKKPHPNETNPNPKSTIVCNWDGASLFIIIQNRNQTGGKMHVFWSIYFIVGLSHEIHSENALDDGSNSKFRCFTWRLSICERVEWRGKKCKKQLNRIKHAYLMHGTVEFSYVLHWLSNQLMMVAL